MPIVDYRGEQQGELRRHLPCISAASHLHLGCISAGEQQGELRCALKPSTKPGADPDALLGKPCALEPTIEAVRP